MDTLLAIVLILIPFVLIFWFSYTRTRKRLRKENEKLAKLSPEEQAKEKQRINEAVLSGISLFAGVIGYNLAKSVSTSDAIIVGILITALARGVIYLIQKIVSKNKATG